MTRVDALCLLSTGHLLRILISLEEPPHLTADWLLVRCFKRQNQLERWLCLVVVTLHAQFELEINEEEEEVSESWSREQVIFSTGQVIFSTDRVIFSTQ